MKRLFCFAAFMFFLAAAYSQKVYFIYLQSESEQPFFVRWRDQVLSTNSSGYLVMSKITDSTHVLKVGFPNNKWPEQHFQVVINGKDRGFLLKNFAEKGWGLFDLQTLAVIMAMEQPKGDAVNTVPREVSAFTEVLSRAANDPSLKERSVLRKPVEPPVVQTAVLTEIVPESKPVPVVTEPKTPAIMVATEVEKKDKELIVEKKEVPKDTVAYTATAKQEPAKVTETAAPIESSPQLDKPAAKVVVTPEGIATSIPEEKKEETRPEEVYTKSVVTRKSESSTTEGFGAVYIDSYADGRQDTIRIIIPNPKLAFSKGPETVKEENRAQDVSVAAPENNNSKTDKAEVPVTKPVTKSAFAPCNAVATESDFLQLRKKMAAQNDDESRIKESRKSFKSKCLTTAQIRNLGNLFQNEAGKFQFYEGAYPFVSDRDQYEALQSEFKDNYFVYRFKKLIRPD